MSKFRPSRKTLPLKGTKIFYATFGCRFCRATFFTRPEKQQHERIVHKKK